MSLFALGKAGPLGKGGPDAARNEVCDALAGNLCRCTGYRPIVDAALDALAEEGRDRFDAQASETIAALKALDVDQPLTIETGGKRYVAPRTLGHLADLVSKNPDAHLLAGGTDVGLWVTKQHRDLDLVIDVTRVPELKRVDESETDLVIGAAVTYHQAHEALRRRFQDFGELVRRIGGRQVREVGTIGGNIANGSPIGDTMPALIALNAVIVLQKGDRRRTLDLEDFYLDYRRTALEPGEFLAEIRLPNSAVDFRCYKISKRFDQDISAVMAAFALELDQDRRVRTMRIGFGGMAAVPKRAAAAEQAMLGQPWNEATIEAGQAALAAELKPLSDMRASAQYRLSVAENLLAKFFIETTRPKARTRVLDRA
jgi:xanthine dehydrogenase small subunit